MGGLLGGHWIWPLLFFAICGHLTNVATTIYLHRAMTHGGVVLHPLVSLPMRVWLWLTTGIVTRQWVACHRKHHAFPDREGDPHSPVLTSTWAIVFNGWAHYRKAAQDRATIDKYGKGCPTDWIERRVFTPARNTGLVLLLALDVLLFGVVWGPLVWTGQMIWMPALGGIVNGVGHAFGYRNYEVKDASRNFFPLGLLLGGEELHNNHHADPRSARFRRRWFEFDIGWIYIKVLSWVRLAHIKYAAKWRKHDGRSAPDLAA